MASYIASSHRAWPLHGGEAGALIRSRDWSATPLGDAEQWPERLRAAVDTCLDAAFASFVWWGPELIQLYNDAALPIVQSRHPAAFGMPAREAWPDDWPDIAALVERVMRTGRPVLGAAMPLRRPEAGPASISFCCTALRDAAGAAAGVLVTAFGAVEAAFAPSRAAPGPLETTDGPLAPAFGATDGEACEDVFRTDNLAGWPALIVRTAEGAPGGRRRWAPDTGFLLSSPDVCDFAHSIAPTPGESLFGADDAGPGKHAGRVGADAAAENTASEQLGVMVAEVQHRTRNLIAVVRAIISRTLATSPSRDAFSRRIDDRLRALSRVQGLLSRAGQEPVTVDALVRLEFGEEEMTRRAPRRERVDITGPAVALRSSLVQTLALALHELAANARKHGALSAGDGRLQIGWWLEQRDGRPWLVLNWVEESPRGAAALSRHEGYGRAFIEQALSYSHGAEIRYELDEMGLWCSIALPLGLQGNVEGRR